MEIDFYKEFIDIKHDTILSMAGSSLLNSDEHYLKYKQRYIKLAKENHDTFQSLFSQYKECIDKEYSTNDNNTKFYYTFTNTDKRDMLLQQLKNIVFTQRNLLSTFDHHVNSLINENLQTDKKSKSFNIFKSKKR